MRFELYNDLTRRMEITYGRIKIIHKPNINDAPARYIICLQRTYGNNTTDGPITHLARKHNELQLRYNLNSPYCRKTYRDLGAINRHRYKKIRLSYILGKYTLY